MRRAICPMHYGILVAALACSSVATAAEKIVEVKTINGEKVLNRTQSIEVTDYPTLFPLFPEGKVTLASLKDNKEALLAELGKTEGYYRVYLVESETKASLLSAFLSSAGKHYIAQSDFVQYADKTVNGLKKHVGYLIRIQADISSLEGNTDLSGLFAVGVAAKAKKVSGSLSVQVYGLSGAKIADVVGQPFALTDEALMKAIESAAVLKSRVRDPDIIVRPEELPDALDKAGGA